MSCEFQRVGKYTDYALIRGDIVRIRKDAPITEQFKRTPGRVGIVIIGRHQVECSKILWSDGTIQWTYGLGMEVLR